MPKDHPGGYTGKDLILLRGLPSSGKSTLARMLVENFVSSIAHHGADHYFYDEEGNYLWDGMKLEEAHRTCYENTEYDMKHGCPTMVVANTFTQEKELATYVALAEKYGYAVTSLIVETRHTNKNTHGVPAETIEKMKDRFSIKL